MSRTWICPHRGLAPFLGLLAPLLLTHAAYAQPDDAEAPADDAEAATSPTDTPDASEDKNATAGASGSASLEASLSGGTEAEASSDASAEASSDEAASASAPIQPEPEATSENVAETTGPEVIVLPEAAYPEWQIRGLKGGSLWLTMQGYQWPYLPLKPGEQPHFVLGLSGSAWVDTGWEKIDRGDPNQPTTESWFQQGRVVLRATPTYSLNEWFLQGQAELVANSDQSLSQPDVADTDDVWVRAGEWKLWDVQVGRYEGWEVYHFGMGLDLHTRERRGAFDTVSVNQADIYGVTYGYYRDDTVGNVGVHVYPIDLVRVELLGKVGATADGLSTLGGRPVGILDLGFMKFKVAGEYLKGQDTVEDSRRETESRGVGAGLEFIFEPYVEFGGNGAIGLIDSFDDQGEQDRVASVTQYSYGAFANARVIENLLVGVGGNFSWLENLEEDALGNVGEFSHAQYFVAVKYALFGQLYLKVVGAYAESKYAPTLSASEPWDNKMFSGRLRASVLF